MIQSETKPRVAIFLSSLEGGGAQRAMLNLAGGFAARGYTIDLLLARLKGPYLAEIPEGVDLVYLGRGRTILSVGPLVRYLRKYRPTTMISALAYVNVVAVLARKLARVPTRVIICEQNQLSRSAGNSLKWRNRITPRLAKWFYPHADAIVAVSAGVRDDLAATLHLDTKQIDVVYNAAVTRTDVIRRAQEPAPHPWFSDDGPPVVVAIGRLHQQKDYPTLFRAFADLRRHRDARLVILGEGPKRPELESLRTELGLDQSLDMPGFVDNPFACLARAQLFVLSSLWEGLPTVLVEALCCGTQVVATDCPSGPREILREPGFGRLVPMSDPDSLAAAMSEALDETEPPPDESWMPFEMNAVVDRYVEILLAN